MAVSATSGTSSSPGSRKRVSTRSISTSSAATGTGSITRFTPTGIEEFSCGALIDANSRLGRKPGDPESTDPEGLIQKPYDQSPRSGGFLTVEVIPSTAGGSELTFTWHDEKGEVLHQTTKESQPTP